VHFAEEVVAQSFVPAWRGALAAALSEQGLAQADIARLLGITQSAVSKHLAGRFVPDARLVGDPRFVAAVARVAAGLASESLTPLTALAEARALVRAMSDRGPICHLHEELMPALAGLGCDLCVAPDSTLVAEQAALADVRAAVRILENTPALGAWLPHVGTNLARCLPGAQREEEVAAIPGGLIWMHERVRAAAPPEFGVSRHMARVALAVLRADAARAAVIDLAPHPDLLAAARAQGLRVVEVDAALEAAPDDLAFDGPVPDVFYHQGAFGIEPVAYLVGADAATLARHIQAWRTQ